MDIIMYSSCVYMIYYKDTCYDMLLNINNGGLLLTVLKYEVILFIFVINIIAGKLKMNLI